jgi:hypothetical protein
MAQVKDECSRKRIRFTKSPQRQQTGITGDLTTRKISSNDSVENAGFAKTQCHQSFRAPFLFFASKIVNNPG